ncbi:unnamed protein product [Mytilus coruscus]|uniref:Uncharacterized protein n=1 Tax=Mytilus coruscus TaxID=42192 RepID=A0A6J8ACX8_MYTCO|nr:unnamed protein product [Mytilus coruscus]
MAVYQLNEILYQRWFTAPAMNEMVEELLGDYEEEDIEDVQLYHMQTPIIPNELMTASELKGMQAMAPIPVAAVLSALVVQITFRTEQVPNATESTLSSLLTYNKLDKVLSVALGTCSVLNVICTTSALSTAATGIGAIACIPLSSLAVINSLGMMGVC